MTNLLIMHTHTQALKDKMTVLYTNKLKIKVNSSKFVDKKFIAYFYHLKKFTKLESPYKIHLFISFLYYITICQLVNENTLLDFAIILFSLGSLRKKKVLLCSPWLPLLVKVEV